MGMYCNILWALCCSLRVYISSHTKTFKNRLTDIEGTRLTQRMMAEASWHLHDFGQKTSFSRKENLGEATQIMSFKVWWKALARLRAFNRRRCRLLSTRGFIWGTLSKFRTPFWKRTQEKRRRLCWIVRQTLTSGRFKVRSHYFKSRSHWFAHFGQGQGHAGSRANHGNTECQIIGLRPGSECAHTSISNTHSHTPWVSLPSFNLS